MHDQEKNVYITTTLPYVNAEPHVGFALEIIRADVLARMMQLFGYQVFFNTGTDEHGSKIYEKAIEAGLDTQTYVDGYAKHFQGLQEKLGLIPEIHFIRTTDKHHEEAAQAFWNRVNANGYIYKKAYQAKYCVGCELEKTDSELVDGLCPVHPNRELQLVDEENYFFKFSAFTDRLLQMYTDRPDFVLPDFRLNEIRTFVEGGLQDFSISRLQNKMPWGVPVPGDPDQVMYVWFDALVNYISTLGWPDEAEDSNFEKFWKNGNPIQLCGKDNLRQQSAMWAAMLLAAELPTTRQIMVGGFINSGGQKMSKSLGNVINPYTLIDEYADVTEYSSDVLRYYLMRHVHPYDDSDMTLEKYKEVYNANLANGLGNLVSRLMNMVVSYDVVYDTEPLLQISGGGDTFSYDNITTFRFDVELDTVWAHIGSLDETISREEPYKMIKVDEQKAKEILSALITQLYAIAVHLEPFMPQTSAKMKELILNRQKPEKPLFLRKE